MALAAELDAVANEFSRMAEVVGQSHRQVSRPKALDVMQTLYEGSQAVRILSDWVRGRSSSEPTERVDPKTLPRMSEDRALRLGAVNDPDWQALVEVGSDSALHAAVAELAAKSVDVMEAESRRFRMPKAVRQMLVGPERFSPQRAEKPTARRPRVVEPQPERITDIDGQQTTVNVAHELRRRTPPEGADRQTHIGERRKLDVEKVEGPAAAIGASRAVRDRPLAMPGPAAITAQGSDDAEAPFVDINSQEGRRTIALITEEALLSAYGLTPWAAREAPFVETSDHSGLLQNLGHPQVTEQEGPARSEGMSPDL